VSAEWQQRSFRRSSVSASAGLTRSPWR